MKVKPVADALERHGAEVVLVHTGQHYDPAMSDVFFSDIHLKEPDFHLGIGSGSFAQQTSRVTAAIGPLIDDLKPTALVVVGDVTPTPACAIVGAQSGTLVCHVEAGLRSRDWSMPEEINRVVTDAVSDLLFAPSPDAVRNLTSEGVAAERITLAGNVMIDTLLSNLERARERPIREELQLGLGRFALVTLHRPVNVDIEEHLGVLMGLLGEVARRLPVVFPVHPRTARRIGDRHIPGVKMIDPLGYLDFIALEAAAAVVLTDSGGVQEETTALGVPCLTLRDNTERPITVDEGTNQLVGRSPTAVLKALDIVLEHGIASRCPDLWDGHAGERIAATVMETATQGSWRRPTDIA